MRGSQATYCLWNEARTLRETFQGANSGGLEIARRIYLPGQGSSPNTPCQPAPARFEERHYTVTEIAELWNLSPDAIRKIFERELGVLVLGVSNSRHKRSYRTLRIPQSVAERVHRRLSNPDLTSPRSRA